MIHSFAFWWGRHISNHCWKYSVCSTYSFLESDRWAKEENWTQSLWLFCPDEVRDGVDEPPTDKQNIFMQLACAKIKGKLTNIKIRGLEEFRNSRLSTETLSFCQSWSTERYFWHPSIDQEKEPPSSFTFRIHKARFGLHILGKNAILSLLKYSADLSGLSCM